MAPGLIDILLFLTDTLPAVYLLDAVAEFILVLVWHGISEEALNYSFTTNSHKILSTYRSIEEEVCY